MSMGTGTYRVFGPAARATQRTGVSNRRRNGAGTGRRRPNGSTCHQVTVTSTGAATSSNVSASNGAEAV
jgi:hypothetical protein